MRIVTASLALMFALSAAASAAVVIPIAATGSASGYENTAGQFDAQPATVPASGTTEDDMGANFAYYTTSGRGVYVDFGENYADITIQQVIIGLKSTGTSPSGSPLCFWSEVNNDVVFDGTDVAAPDFMFNWTGATGDKSWQEIWTGSETPAHRYYIMAFDGTQTWSNRGLEVVYAGLVPEPATMGLLAVGGLALLRRRRA